MDKKVKTGGRQIGTPNQLTKELRSKLNMFINENYDLFIKDYHQLEPKDRINIYVKLYQTAMPKPLESELQDHDITITIE